MTSCLALSPTVAVGMALVAFPISVGVGALLGMRSRAWSSTPRTPRGSKSRSVVAPVPSLRASRQSLDRRAVETRVHDHAVHA